jgi:glycerophosphoryl diester phosphodiesterase
MANLARKPLIFAHRGACSYAPENTLAAFRLALEQGADGIELDAKLSKDGVVVVIHDQTVDRTTNGSGKVSELTFAELKDLDAGIQFASRFTGEKVPSLEQVLDSLGEKLLINIELTSYASPGDALPEKVAELVKKAGTERNTIFSSFHPAILGRIRKLMPDVPAGLLTGEGWLQWGNSFLGRRISPELIHPYFTKTTRDFIEKAHLDQRKVNTWTVDDPREIFRLVEDGVDGIITDDPLLAIRVRDGK